MEIFLVAGIFLIFGFLIFEKFFAKKSDEKNLAENEKLKFECENFLQKNAELREKLENSEQQKNEFAGKNKILFVENQNLKNSEKNFREKIAELEKNLAEFRAAEKNRAKNFTEKIEKLAAAEKNFTDEKVRLQKNDEIQKQKILDRRDKIWTEHENSTLAKLRDAAQKLSFNFFENAAPPPELENLRPDFCVEFLEQFLIFDAKTSKSKENLQNYLSENAKLTAKKYAKNQKICSTIFFVVPEIEIQNLRKIFFAENRFQIFVIAPSAVEPVLAAHKKISNFKLAEKLSPLDREKIVNFVADLQNHVNFQNAANLILTRRGAEILQNREKLPPKISDEIEKISAEKRLENLKIAEMKKFWSPENQQIEIEKLRAPAPKIAEKNFAAAKKILENAEIFPEN